MNPKRRSLLTVYLPGLLMVFGIAGMTNSVNAADGIPGTASLSGTVNAESPLTAAAHVYANIHDESILDKDKATGAVQFGQPATQGVELVSNGNLNPEGSGPDIAEETCIPCHGPDFIPMFKKSRSEWLVTIDRMLDQYGGSLDGMGSAITITPAQRDVLADYLASNFGPDTPMRRQKIDVEKPLN